MKKNVTTLEEMRLERHIIEKEETIARLERELNHHAPTAWWCEVIDAEFALEELYTELAELELELCRLTDRNFAEIVLDGDQLLSRWDEYCPRGGWSHEELEDLTERFAATY